ncbi:hypothetical protein GPECTOR_3g32 [Gonium pectorale]|uniref:Bystin n=1 Tax=Gonium pectorale TaxID=33097 RepID=A0A150GZJ0_GONPE|nr:hypothetical protein GPECTOR_3g32 [Gonium pectorale]|eukprot:KXZ55173.1 hypothetical protein GPECTOR_3g32 [Gonium pectorale]
MPPKKARVRKPKHRKSLHEQIEDPQSYGVRLLDVKLSGRILKAAREQQEDLDAEEAFEREYADDDDDDGEEEGEGKRTRTDPQAALRAALAKLGSSSKGGPGGAAAGDDSEDDDSDGGRGGGLADEGYEEEEVEVDPDDERALSAFLAPGASSYRQTSLADMVLQRLRERQAEAGLQRVPEEGADPDSEPGPVPEGLEPRVVEVYRGVGRLLARYSAGKVPKAFKIIPNLRNWEDVLYLTEPESWSVHAVYAATRLFVSNLNARLAQRFLALVLLPRVRSDIRQNKRLHFALFQALRKATYKPAAFYKARAGGGGDDEEARLRGWLLGILLPLCQSRTCNLREAVILSSVLQRASLPVLHSAAALLRLASLEYCGTTSFFMRVLLDKKYALPYRVIDSLVDHFVRFADDERAMPVVWHQCLLCFVQRYKNEIRPADMAALRAVTPEVLRELDHGTGRGGAVAGGGAAPMLASGLGAAAALAAPAAVGVPAKGRVGANVVENVRDMPPVLLMEE